MEYTVNRYDCSRKIMVITNMGCNLDCIYCYERHKENHTVFDLNETLNKLSQILNTKTPKGTLIKLLGGEPFLVFPNIKKLCESIWDNGYRVCQQRLQSLSRRSPIFEVPYTKRGRKLYATTRRNKYAAGFYHHGSQRAS